MRLTVDNALEALTGEAAPFKRLFAHGTVQIEIYQPRNADKQQPHTRDEIYVVASGSGHFIKRDVQQRVETGEVLFVPAGVEHRFVDFTTDFSTWVIFYGPEGGERQ